MAVIMALSTRRDPQALIHSYERHEPDQNSHAQQQILPRLHHDKPNLLRRLLTQEDLRQQMENSIAQQAADSKRDHDTQRRRINVRRTQCKQEIGRAGDVERRQQRVYGWAAWEEDAEGARDEARSARVLGEFLPVQGFDDRALLDLL
jgi:hypothetical protein